MHHPTALGVCATRPCYHCGVVRPPKSAKSGPAWMFPLLTAPLNWMFATVGRVFNPNSRTSSFESQTCDTLPPKISQSASLPQSDRTQPSRVIPLQLNASESGDETDVDYDDGHDDDVNKTGPSIEVQLCNVHLTLDKKQILSGLDLEIRRGESLAIIGTSGTGKSTTLRLISGLLMPTSGEVKLRGDARIESISDTFMSLRGPDSDMKKQILSPRIAMAFQDAALFDSMTVNENIEIALKQHTKLKPDTTRMARVVRLWLARVGLNGEVVGDKLPGMLSGGMKKRVSFARAVCFDPKYPKTAPDVLLYDEPTAGLDSFNSTRVENLICDLREFCPTCVIVTHQFSTIRRTSNRVVFLHGGKKVWDGPTESLDTTDNPYVRQFLTSSLEGPLTEDSIELQPFLDEFEILQSEENEDSDEEI